MKGVMKGTRCMRLHQCAYIVMALGHDRGPFVHFGGGNVLIIIMVLHGLLSGVLLLIRW